MGLAGFFLPPTATGSHGSTPERPHDSHMSLLKSVKRTFAHIAESLHITVPIVKVAVRCEAGFLASVVADFAETARVVCIAEGIAGSAVHRAVVGVALPMADIVLQHSNTLASNLASQEMAGVCGRGWAVAHHGHPDLAGPVAVGVTNNFAITAVEVAPWVVALKVANPVANELGGAVRTASALETIT